MAAEIEKYIKKMEEIQNSLLQYIEKQENNEAYFADFTKLVDQKKILENSHEFKSFLHLLSKISNNHHRNLNFIEKIEKIIQHYKNQIQKYFSNFDIFVIFKSNKRIILFLIEQKIISIDKQIASEILTEKYDKYKYRQYFYPEIKPFLKSTEIDEINFEDFSEDFGPKRKIGQTDSYLAKLIREDNIDDFIIYVNKSLIHLSSQIQISLFETNSFLLKQKKVTLIEYAAFFGSIQIFQYLLYENVALQPSLWLFSIHSNNGELIRLLERNRVEIQNPNSLLFESIKCHHNNIANYIKDYKCDDTNHSIESLKFYNFNYIQIDQIGQSSFYSLCKYDYYVLIDILMNNNMIDVNKKECNDSEGYRSQCKDRKAPLCCAVLKRNIDIIERLLLCDNIDVNITNEYDYNDGYSYSIHTNSSLHIAVEKEYTEIVKLLLTNKNINVNLKNVDDDDNKPALYLAVERGNIEIVKLLLSFKGIRPNILYIKEVYGDDGGTFITGKSALYCAIENENIEIIKLLLNCPNLDVNIPYRYIFGDLVMLTSEEKTPLELAVEKGNREIVLLLLSCKNIDVNHNFDGTCLHKAVEKGNIEIIYLLLSCKNIDVNAIKETPDKDGKTALHIAILLKNIEVVKLLLTSRNIDVNLPTISRKYIPKGIDITSFDQEYMEINPDDEGDINKFLEMKERNYRREYSKIDYEPIKKDSPLYLAVKSNEIEIIKLLLCQKGIDKSKKYIFTKNENILKLFSFYEKFENLK